MIKMLKGPSAPRARRLNDKTTVNNCILRNLASNLLLDRQRHFYRLIGILIMLNPKLAVFMNKV